MRLILKHEEKFASEGGAGVLSCVYGVMTVIGQNGMVTGVAAEITAKRWLAAKIGFLARRELFAPRRIVSA